MKLSWVATIMTFKIINLYFGLATGSSTFYSGSPLFSMADSNQCYLEREVEPETPNL